MIYTFKRRRLLQGCGAVAAVGIVGGVIAVALLAIPWTFWWLKLVLIIPAGALAFLIPGIFGDAFSLGPILTISAEGIRYLPFSRETVPWSAVANLTLTRGYSHSRGASDYRRLELMDGVSFVVTDPARFPAPPGGVRADNIPVSIMAASVQASPQEILDAVRACWSGGDIREVDGIPAGATLPSKES